MKRFVLYISLLITVFSLASCDLFETRDAETPDQPRSNFEQAIEPEIVLSNLVYSLQDRNVSNYIACFSDSSYSGKSFTFSPSAGAASQYPELVNDWDKNSEEQYFNNLTTRIPDDAQITLTFTNDSYNQLGDSAIFTATYTLNVPQNENSIPTNYSGEMRLSLIRDSRSLWSIYYWLDIKKDENSSWSELKGRLYY
jgi:hypothetical protein